MTITTEQIQAVLDRLHAGATVKAEAAQLGMTYDALRRTLEQVIGLEAYFSLVAASRLRRMKLPPSRNYLNEQVAGAGEPQGKTD